MAGSISPGTGQETRDRGPDSHVVSGIAFRTQSRGVSAPSLEPTADDGQQWMTAVMPVVRRVVRSRIGASLDPADGSMRNQDALDLVGEIAARLLRDWRRVREEGAPAIADVEAFAGVVAVRRCAEYVRSRHPERARLHLRLRYALQHSHWAPRVQAERLQVGQGGLPLDRATILERLAAARWTSGLDTPAALTAWLDTALQDLHGLVPISVIVDAMASGAPRAVTVPIEDVPTPASSERPVDAMLILRADTSLLWQEVTLLPVAQRRALLLNLRDEGGGNALAHLVGSGVASLAMVAAAVEWSLDRLTLVWTELPWPDDRIGESLGCARQQVINLRKSARARLRRRLLRDARR